DRSGSRLLEFLKPGCRRKNPAADRWKRAIPAQWRAHKRKRARRTVRRRERRAAFRSVFSGDAAPGLREHSRFGSAANYGDRPDSKNMGAFVWEDERQNRVTERRYRSRFHTVVDPPFPLGEGAKREPGRAKPQENSRKIRTATLCKRIANSKL